MSEIYIVKTWQRVHKFWPESKKYTYKEITASVSREQADKLAWEILKPKLSKSLWVKDSVTNGWREALPMGSQVRAQCYLLAGDLGQGSYSLRLQLLICEVEIVTVLHIELLGSSLLHSTQNSTWHTGALKRLQLYYSRLFLISPLPHTVADMKDELKSGLRYQGKAKGKVRSLNMYLKLKT